MAIPPTDNQILFTNYDIITYFLNLASCSEHFISIKHRILTTFNINNKNSILTACMPLTSSCYLTVACTMCKNNCIRPTDILKYHVNNDRKIKK